MTNIYVTIPSRVKQEGHGYIWGSRKNAHSACVGKPKERDCLENLNGRIISKFYLKKWGGRTWIGFIWLKTWTSNRMLGMQQ
jgi:hypothetical protein